TACDSVRPRKVSRQAEVPGRRGRAVRGSQPDGRGLRAISLLLALLETRRQSGGPVGSVADAPRADGPPRRPPAEVAWPSETAAQHWAAGDGRLRMRMWQLVRSTSKQVKQIFHIRRQFIKQLAAERAEGRPRRACGRFPCTCPGGARRPHRRPLDGGPPAS